jgi:ketosteroid isomerase-like protein
MMGRWCGMWKMRTIPANRLLIFIDRRACSGLPSESHMTDVLSNFLQSARSRLAVAGVVLSALLLATATFAQPAQRGMPRAEKHEGRHVVDQLEETWRNAVLKDDASAMQPLLADDYMGITPYGTLQSKDDLLASLRTGSLHLTALDISDRKVRFYGATALVNSTVGVEGVSPDGTLSGSYRYTHVYIRDSQGNWKIVSSEASRVHHPRAHK